MLKTIWHALFFITAEGGVMDSTVLLRMEHIHKKFPGVYALNDVALTLNRGEVHALLGENGAGKSTLIKILGGIYHADEGDIYIDDKKVTINSVHDASKYGVAVIHQELVLVPYMTVAENIFLGREPGKGIFVNYAAMVNRANRLFEELGMDIKASSLIKDLSIAQQQMVEIVKAISFDSKILVMDEPTSSISDKEVERLFGIMRTLTAKGVGIIYISHKMSELEQICDRVTVMRDGQCIGTKDVKETSRDELITMMVGRELTNYYTRDYQSPGKEILRVDHMSDGAAVKDASFYLREGEIIGFAGLVGAGRSETMQALFGLSANRKGDVYIDGKKVNINNPVEAIKLGIAFVPEDRKREGLYQVQSVKYNSTIEVLELFINNLRVDAKLEKEITQKYIDMMSTKTPHQNQVIGALSGGNQQKVLFGRWLATNPRILILDEPTRGIDVKAKSEIYAIMNELVKTGVSIIMISSELPEIINMSDRVYVMADGVIAGCLDHADVDQEKIMQLAAI